MARSLFYINPHILQEHFFNQNLRRLALFVMDMTPAAAADYYGTIKRYMVHSIRRGRAKKDGNNILIDMKPAAAPLLLLLVFHQSISIQTRSSCLTLYVCGLRNVLAILYM